MTSQADVRLWLTGVEVEGLPQRKLPEAVRHSARGVSLPPEPDSVDGSLDALEEEDRSARPRKKKRPRVDPDKLKPGRWTRLKGLDARLKFGRYEGMKLSELARGDHSQTAYLDWLLKEAVPDDLKKRVRHQQLKAL